MPNWKKLVVSGSDAHLNSLSVAENVTASSFTGSFSGDGSQLTNLSVPTQFPIRQNLGLVSGSININLDLGTLIELELVDDSDISFSSSELPSNSFIDFTLQIRDLNEFTLSFQELDILPQQEISTSTTERSLILGKYLGQNQSIFKQLINLKDFNNYVDGDYVENYFV